MSDDLLNANGIAPTPPGRTEFSATCRSCGSTSSVPAGFEHVTAAEAALTRKGWGHDKHGFRLCPDCLSASAKDEVFP